MPYIFGNINAKDPREQAAIIDQAERQSLGKIARFTCAAGENFRLQRVSAMQAEFNATAAIERLPSLSGIVASIFLNDSKDPIYLGMPGTAAADTVAIATGNDSIFFRLAIHGPIYSIRVESHQNADDDVSYPVDIILGDTIEWEQTAIKSEYGSRKENAAAGTELDAVVTALNTLIDIQTAQAANIALIRADIAHIRSTNILISNSTGAIELDMLTLLPDVTATKVSNASIKTATEAVAALISLGELAVKDDSAVTRLTTALDKLDLLLTDSGNIKTATEGTKTNTDKFVFDTDCLKVTDCVGA